MRCEHPDVERNAFGQVTLGVVQARQKAARDGKCHCPSRKRIPTERDNGLGRRWVACERCLGSIRQLS